jgi:hypothetical protein
VIFPPHCGDSACAWGLGRMFVRHIAPTKMPLWRGFTGPTGKSAYKCITQAPSSRCVRSPRRFSSTTIMNAPKRRRACSNVPPRVAFTTLPTFPSLPERVDPDAWLASLDQKMYLRHVGRDGCVDVDLTTYYIGPKPAGRTVLLQVWAQQHQFAVWEEDQIVKLLPIKGLVGQQMALDDYLQYIKQEALATPTTVVGSGIQKSPAAASMGRGGLIPPFFRRLSHMRGSAHE